ncbi:MAG: Brp/Blh family beta-carotene 15,15'-dioxygenase [Planctomycetota bacterium]
MTLTAIGFAAATLVAFGWIPTAGATLVLFLVGLSFLGLPHGGIDHRLALAVLDRQQSGSDTRLPRWMEFASFFVVYLAVAAAVVAGWYLSPLLTVCGFFLLASWHFGLEEDETASSSTWIHQPGVIARGGMVIWVTMLFRSSEVASLLDIVLPTNLTSGSWIVDVICWLSPVWMMLLAIDIVRQWQHQTGQQLFVTLVRLTSFALMFAVCPVLLSFAIYFCYWHSVRGLVHLRAQFDGSAKQLAIELVPMSALAVLLFVGGFVAYLNQLTPSEAAIRASFIGLSAVAIPHLLLHVISDVLEPAGVKINASLSWNRKATSC